MRAKFLASAAVSALLAATGLGVDLAALPADANPLPYVNTPFDTPNGATNTLIGSINSTSAPNQYPVTCSGNSTGTCNGLRFVESVTNLTTAPAGNVSALVTVADSSVTTSSDIFCTVENYTGTGQPIVANVTAANAGNMTFQILNAAASGSLSATVPVHCFVTN